MSESTPDLHMLNVVVADMSASLDFYRQLGVAVPVSAAAAGGHMQLRMPGGFSLELHTAGSARLWHGGWRTDPVSVGVVIGFSLPTRRAVDEGYAELTSADNADRQPLFDAFWGVRYAIVADPDGNDVGLMSPVGESRRTWPPGESPLPETASATRLADGPTRAEVAEQTPRSSPSLCPASWHGRACSCVEVRARCLAALMTAARRGPA